MGRTWRFRNLLLCKRQKIIPKRQHEAFVIPTHICKEEEINTLWMRGIFPTIPRFIFKQNHLTSLGLSGHFESVPESVGGMKELTSLDLSSCHDLTFLPSSIGNLSNLTSLDFTNCSNLVNIPLSPSCITFDPSDCMGDSKSYRCGCVLFIIWLHSVWVDVRILYHFIHSRTSPRSSQLLSWKLSSEHQTRLSMLCVVQLC